MLMASSRRILIVIVVGLALEFSAAVSQVVFFFSDTKLKSYRRLGDTQGYVEKLDRLLYNCADFTIRY